MDIAKQNKLALEIANALDDMDGLQSFRRMTERYSEEHLREKLLKTLSVHGINNKAAYFTTLVTGNAKRSPKRSWN